MYAFLADWMIAARNVLRQRRRSSTAIAAIAFGVAALLLAGGFIDWMFYGMREWTILSRLGHVQIVKSGYLENGLSDPFEYLLPETSEARARIERLPEVRVLGERIAFNGLISRGESTISFIAEGVEPDKEHLLSRTLAIPKGSDLSIADPRGIIVGQGLAANLGVGVGESVVLMANTKAGGVNAVECRVRGFFSTVSKAYDDTALRVPIATARELLKVSGAHQWVLLLGRTEDTVRVVAELKARLAGQPLQVVAWQELADLYNKTVTLFSRQVTVMKWIVALIIVLSISNTMMMSVMERTGEIGTAMALGVRRPRVMRTFLMEGALLGMAGGAFGLAAGLAGAWIVSRIGIPMPPPPGMARGYVAEIATSWALSADAFLLAVGTTLAASVYPAWKASRMVIVDALRFNR
ncbi:MAG: ABC transporter permease [Rhodocyclaceae bacterium]